MKLGHRLAAAVGVLALTSGMAVVAGPAHAATPAPKVTLTVEDFSNPTHARYGDGVSVTASADEPTDDYSVTGGTLVIQAAPVGSAAWSTVATGSTYTYYNIDEIKAPTQFRAVFTGGTGSYYGGDDITKVSYPTATSATSGITSLDRGEALAKKTKHKECYRVGPAPYKNKPIKNYVRIGKSKKWRYSYTIRTNKKSQYCFKISHKHVKAPKHVKGPKYHGFKTVYVKAGGMKKSVVIDTF